ncbi:MAG: LPS-assembly protein LptD [Candidatus Sabulitectum sp.]|nr:LPS-assembly protein LptD [Candidatus Sabulitectum sp.]
MLTVSLLLLLLSQPDTTETEPLQTMAYGADSLVFSISDEDLILVGNASIEHKQMSIAADTIRYLSIEETVRATGNVEMAEGGDDATGSALIYHLPTATARTFSTTSFYDRAQYNSETVTMLSREEFNLTNVVFTSCEKDTFDYYFWAEVMKVYPDDKAVAKPIILYVQDTPVFWLPYAVFPIRRGRSSGFTIPTVGSSSRDGRYIRKVGYYFGFSDYIDLLISSDLMEKTRFQLTATERHNLRYVLNGRNRIQWRRQFESSRDRWLIDSEHKQELPDGTMLRLTGNFVSDRSYLEDTQQNPQERMEGQLRSWLSFSRNMGRGSAQVNFEYTEYLSALPDTIDNEILSELSTPDIRYNRPSSPLFSLPSDPGNHRIWHSLYWNLSSHYLTEQTEWEDSSFYNAGIKVSSSLSGSNRLGGILAVSPWLNTTGTVYHRDRSGNRLPGWLHPSIGLSLSTDVYGMFSTSLAGFSILRHTITPSISTSWSPTRYMSLDGSYQATEEAESLFYRFSDFSLPSSGTVVTFSLLNLLEGKRLNRGAIEKKTLAELSLTSSWSPERDQEIFSPVSASLNLTPTKWLSSRISGSYNGYTRKTDGISFTTGIQLSGNDPTMQPDSGFVLTPLSWRLSLSHSFIPALYSADDDLNKLRLSVSIDLTTRWALNYRAYYDATGDNFISQDYSIMRDLDSWEAVFTRHISDVDTGFYFRINIKVFPDIKVEQHASSF